MKTTAILLIIYYFLADSILLSSSFHCTLLLTLYFLIKSLLEKSMIRGCFLSGLLIVLCLIASYTLSDLTPTSMLPLLSLFSSLFPFVVYSVLETTAFSLLFPDSPSALVKLASPAFFSILFLSLLLDLPILKAGLFSSALLAFLANALIAGKPGAARGVPMAKWAYFGGEMRVAQLSRFYALWAGAKLFIVLTDVQWQWVIAMVVLVEYFRGFVERPTIKESPWIVAVYLVVFTQTMFYKRYGYESYGHFVICEECAEGEQIGWIGFAVAVVQVFGPMCVFLLMRQITLIKNLK